MEKGAVTVKLIVFNGKDFGYWKNWTHNYLLSQGHAIGEIIQEAYMIPVTLENATQGELQRYENNYKTLNLITTALGRNVYDRVSYLEIAHDVWLKLFIRALLRLSLRVNILTIGSIKPSLRNLVNLLMIALLGLCPS
jgi:hypothetical protein